MMHLAPESSLHILVVDDHAVVRQGLIRIMQAVERDWMMSEAESGFQALDMLGQQRFDLVLMDISMPGLNGLEVLRRIRCDFPRTKVLMLSMHAEEQYAMRSFKAGANGYVTKDQEIDELRSAIRKVLSGGTYVSGGMAEAMAQRLNGSVCAPLHGDLSEREMEVLKRLVAGHRSVDIARSMSLSNKTISYYRGRIMNRLQLASTAALIRYGLEMGLGLAVPAPAVEARPIEGLSETSGHEHPAST